MSEKVGEIEAKHVDARCPNCGQRISQASTVESVRDESYFVGYRLKCPKCGYDFYYKLY